MDMLKMACMEFEAVTLDGKSNSSGITTFISAKNSGK